MLGFDLNIDLEQDFTPIKLGVRADGVVITIIPSIVTGLFCVESNESWRCSSDPMPLKWAEEEFKQKMWR